MSPPLPLLPPIVLIDQVASRQVVAVACEAAQSAGVRPGMTLSEARALCPGLAHAPHDPAADLRALDRLGRWLVRFSPVVAPEPPDAIFLDVTGSERLFHGIDTLARHAADALARLGVAARVAVAPTPGAAWAMTHRDEGGRACPELVEGMKDEKEGTPPASSFILPPSSLNLSRLPPWSLRLDAATTATLHHLGIETVGQLLDLPRESLLSRFGPNLLRRIDQALGRCPEPLVPLAHETPVRARMEFDGAVESLEVIWLVFRELIGRVLAQLIRRGAGARRVDVEFRRAAAPPVRKTVLLSRPSRDAGNLFNLLRCATENVRSDDGFTGVRLSVPLYERLGDEQGLLTDGEQRAAEADLAHLVERLTVRLGQEAVVRARLHESHLPERAYVVDVGATAPCTGDATRLPSALTSASSVESSRVAPARRPKRPAGNRATPFDCAHGRQTSPQHPRPLHLSPTPQEIRVTSGPSHDGDGVPLTFAAGRSVHRVAHATGPERICGVWWEGRHKTRDYYDVEGDAGRRFWVFRVVETGKWYLHGEYE